VSLPPESIEVGKCYLTDVGQVRRILHILPNGRVAYERRPAHRPEAPWQEANQDLSTCHFGRGGGPTRLRPLVHAVEVRE
jgi:hypothetical protein